MDTQTNENETFGEMIFAYTRAQAIDDGVLVDMTVGDLGKLTREAGFRYHVACTAEVFGECVALTDAAERAGCDLNGRLWDILWMLKSAIRSSRSTDRIQFSVFVVRDRVRPTRTDLIAVCGPGDDAEPVITIMFPGQD